MSERYSFVTTTELKDYMSGIGLDADQASATQDVLDGLQRELERYCQRRFERKERTEVLIPDEVGRLWPKATPIVSVSVPVGVTVAHGSNAIIGAGYGYYPLPDSPGTAVTYVGGLDPEDEDDANDLSDIRLAILRIASREATALHSDVLDPNDLTARPARPRDGEPLGWTDRELAKFDRLRRRTVV